MGLALYPEADLERFDVQVRFGQQLLELAVLGLDLTQRARKLSGACVAKAGSAGLWKSGIALAPLPAGALSADFWQALAAAAAQITTRERVRMALC